MNQITLIHNTVVVKTSFHPGVIDEDVIGVGFVSVVGRSSPHTVLLGCNNTIRETFCRLQFNNTSLTEDLLGTPMCERNNV